MRNVIIYSILFFYLSSQPMNRANLLQSNNRISFSTDDVEQMHIFDNSSKNIQIKVSLEKASDILNFLNAAHAVKQGTMSRKYFGVKCEFQCDERCGLSDLLKFQICEIEKMDQFSKQAIAVMSIAEEVRAIELGIIFLSELTSKRDHDKMFSAIIPAMQEIVFQRKLYDISNQRTVTKLHFFQKIFLYGIYERTTLQRVSLEQDGFIVPLMKGYVARFVIKSLSMPLRKWAKSKIKKLKKIKMFNL